jgi:hypothetical protein
MYDENFCLGASLNGFCRLSVKREYNCSHVSSYLVLLGEIFVTFLVNQNVWHQKVDGLFSDEANSEGSFHGLLKALSPNFPTGTEKIPENPQ